MSHSRARWYSLKLTRLGEKTDSHVLYNEMRAIFGEGVEYFFPFKVLPKGYTNKPCVLDGYIFVRLYKKEHIKSPYFDSLSKRSIPAKEIDRLKIKLNGLVNPEFEVGATVYVQDGPLNNMYATIISIDGENLTLSFLLASKSHVDRVPKCCVVLGNS